MFLTLAETCFSQRNNANSTGSPESKGQRARRTVAVQTERVDATCIPGNAAAGNAHALSLNHVLYVVDMHLRTSEPEQ